MTVDELRALVVERRAQEQAATRGDETLIAFMRRNDALRNLEPARLDATEELLVLAEQRQKEHSPKKVLDSAGFFTDATGHWKGHPTTYRVECICGRPYCSEDTQTDHLLSIAARMLGARE